DDIVAANPARRTILRNSLGLSILSVFGATLAGCGSSSDDDDDSPAPGDGDGGDNGGTDPTGPDYSVNFEPPGDKIMADTVTVPQGYVAEVLSSAGHTSMIGSLG